MGSTNFCLRPEVGGGDAEERKMGKGKVTSAKAASAASKVLTNPKSTKAEKRAAASALSQRSDKR